MKQYTKEIIIEIALQCKTKTEFKNKFITAYKYAKKEGIYEEVCKHMIKPNKYFTIESIMTESIKCRTRQEFISKYPGAASAARKKGIYEEVCKHMITRSYSMPQIILKAVLENLYNVSCKYNDRTAIKPYELDLYFKDYNLAFEYNGIRWHLNDIVDKNILCKNKNILLITIVQTSKNYEQHIKEQLINHLDIINVKFNKKIIKEQILNFKMDYIKLIPNLQDIKDICLTYNNYTEFRTNEKSICRILQKYKLTDELTSHMIRNKKQYTKYDIEEIKDIIKNYSGTCFSKDYPAIYSFLIYTKKHKYLLENISNITIWNESNIKEEIAKYKTLYEFMKYGKGCYNALKRLNLEHLLEQLIRKKQEYSIEYCIEIISKYKSVKELRENDNGVYMYCFNNNLKHLYKKLKQREIWTEEKLLNYINKYTTLKEFRDNEPKIYDVVRSPRYKYLLSNLEKYV